MSRTKRLFLGPARPIFKKFLKIGPAVCLKLAPRTRFKGKIAF
jgi:hypothetical protein